LTGARGGYGLRAQRHGQFRFTASQQKRGCPSILNVNLTGTLAKCTLAQTITQFGMPKPRAYCSVLAQGARHAPRAIAPRRFWTGRAAGRRAAFLCRLGMLVKAQFAGKKNSDFLVSPGGWTPTNATEIQLHAGPTQWQGRSLPVRRTLETGTEWVSRSVPGRRSLR
jgi:hypothetical protein